MNEKEERKKEDIEEEKILKKIQNQIPDELIDIIKSYLPIKSVVFLNKVNYLQHHSLVRNFISRSQLENYIRDMLRRDCVFVFNQILCENYKKWMKINHYVHNQVMYYNYIFFIKDYCIQHESPKCRQIVNDFLTEKGLSKNKHKNNIHKNKRWKI